MRKRNLPKLPAQQAGVELERLRSRIKERYGSVYRFAPAVGFTQSMLSRMLHGQRKIFPYARELMADLLEIPEAEHDLYFGGGT